jgi:hypothetical protein
MRLDQVSKQMGFNTRVSPKKAAGSIDNSGSLNDPSEEPEILNASVIEQEEDSQPVEKKPGLRMALMSGLLASTVGVGIVVTLWSGSSTKTADAQKTKGANSAATDDSSQQISDLKAEVALQKQKEDAAKLVASRTKAASPKASPSPTDSPSPSPAASSKPATLTPVQTNVASASTQPVPRSSSTPQKATPVARSSRATSQDSSQLAALRSAVQREKETLANLRKQQTTAQAAKPAQTATTKQVAAVQPKAQVVQPVSRQSSANSNKSSWEDVAESASYGGNGTATVASSSSSGTNVASNSADQVVASADDRGGELSPQLRLPVGKSVSAKLATTYYSLIKNTGSTQASQSADKQSTSVVLEQPIEMGSGWRIPAGSVVEFSMQIADNGLIQAVSKRVISGNVVVPVPQGTFNLTGADNQPLMAQIKSVNDDQRASADINGAILGAGSEIGKTLADSGNQSTTTIGANTVISNVNNQVSGGNILGAGIKGISNQILQQSTARNTAVTQQLDKQSKVGFLTKDTKVQVSVSQSVAFQVPLEGAAQAGLVDPRATQISRADVPTTTSESSLTPIVSNSSSASETVAPPPSPPTAAETDPDVSAKTGAKAVTNVPASTVPTNTVPDGSGPTPKISRSMID